MRRCASGARMLMRQRATAQVRDRLNGTDAFPVGTLTDGTILRLAPSIVGRPSLVFGASGKGKSRLIHLLLHGWIQRERCLPATKLRT